MKKLFYVLCLFALCTSNACKKDKSGTFYGDETAFGGGTAKTYATLDEDGKPTAVGITISKSALNALPTAAFDKMLDLPDEAHHNTPFHFLSLNYATFGHPPLGIYDVAHFDLHFYKIDMEEAMAIGEDDTLQGQVAPPAGYLPTTYVAANYTSMMGTHWVDVSAPEFNGQAFDKTFIYGTFDGEITFYEPMIERSQLQNGNVFTVDIKQPDSYAPSGNYPMQYRTTYDSAGNASVELVNFVAK